MNEEKEIKPTKQDARPTKQETKGEKEKVLYLERLDAIVRHIQNVQSNALLLAQRLIEQDGECELARQLVANSLGHDASKLFGIEWDYLLSDDKEKLKMAIEQHNKTNTHHPEHWDGVDNMPRVYVAEFVCDTFTRSQEMGTDYLVWLKTDASKRWSFSTTGGFYKKCKYFYDLLVHKFVKL